MQSRICSYLFFTVLFNLSCKQDMSAPSDVKIEMETKLDTLTTTEVASLIAPSKSDSHIPNELESNANEIEKKADAELTKKAVEIIQKSKYKSCKDVLIDYENCIQELKEGNSTPMMNFPIDTDPTCRLCSKNEVFLFKMDSLKRIAKSVYKKSNETQ
jgi:hypothetical protein